MKLRFSLHYTLGTLLLLALLGLHRSDIAAMEWLRHKSFDFYQQMEPRLPDPAKMAAEVAIVDIDEAALSKYGQWPWPRTTLARLVEALTQAQVAVIGFDMVFAEEDRASPALIVEEYPQLAPEVQQAITALPHNEVIFADALTKGRVVLGQVGTSEPQKSRKAAARRIGFALLSPNAKKLVLPSLHRYQGLISNRPELEAAAAGVGLFSTQPDGDGMIRRVALVEQVIAPEDCTDPSKARRRQPGGIRGACPPPVLKPSLTLEMLRVALGGRDDYLLRGFRDGSAGVESIVVKTANPAVNFEIPTDSQGRVYVHFSAPRVTAKASQTLYFSAADVLSGNPATLKALAGKLVLIGTSAVGLKDIRQTPISNVLPGVEVHAQLLETILSNSHITRPVEAVMLEFGLIVLGGVLMIVLVPRLSARWNFLLTLALITALTSAAWHFYTAERQLLDALYPSLCIFIMFLGLSYLNYMHEEKERRRARVAFGHYVSPALLDQIAENPDRLVLGGETRNITLLFSDIRGFTTISERFNAAELTRFINRYLTPMTNVIMAHEGTIDKYMGDAIMAFWNAPLDVKNHAEKACIAALKMQEAVKALNETLQQEAANERGSQNRRHYTAPIAIGIGLNTGDCCVGNMGSDQRFDYSALGDDVNLASRLEGQSKTYGVDIVLGQNTVAQLPEGRFALIELDLIQVKGKTEPVRIYALLGEAAERFTPVQQCMAALLEAYRNRQWQEADRLARRLPQFLPALQGLSELYLERIEAFHLTPPPESWNGVYVATSK